MLWIVFPCLVLLAAVVLRYSLASGRKTEHRSALGGCSTTVTLCVLLLWCSFPGKWKAQREWIRSMSHLAGSCRPNETWGFSSELLLWEIWNVTVVCVGSFSSDSGPSSPRSVWAAKYSLESQAGMCPAFLVRCLSAAELAKSVFGAMGIQLCLSLPPAPSY